MSLNVSHISKVYGKQEVLHNVSFQIGKGEIVSFLGSNGAGKSTCMKIITGWLKPDSGSISICGYDIGEEALPAKRHLGYLAENNPLYPEMYVTEYLKYVAQLYSLPDTRPAMNNAIEQTGLTEVRGKTIGTLSKGYRQRVGMAQAILHNPSVLILDEPFSGLDPNQLSEMHLLVRELGKEKTILFSSHSLSEVSELCERTLIINHGKIVADSSISELTKENSLEEKFKELTQ